jgi:GNAT superfamily N-acetyltransferase
VIDRPGSVLTIREATPADSASIAELVSDLGYPSSESEMRARLVAIDADARYRTLVAQVGSTVEGVAGVRLGLHYERNGTYAQILVLAVRASHHRTGIGRALVEACESWAKSQGASVVIVTSGRQRTNAHRFYEALGYASTGLRFIKGLTSTV